MNAHKPARLMTGAAILLLGGACRSAGDRPAAPHMAMTTEVPPGVATPDRLTTRLGSLTSFDGVPDEATTRRVFDNLDFQNAVQAYLASLPIASMSAMRTGMLGFGPPNTTVLQFAELMDSKALWLTPNTVSVYQGMWLELGDEPMVLETPPNVLGLIDDAWFLYVGDFGNAGPDRGQGGKFLMLPPGHEGDVPDGYHVLRTNTHGNWVIWRGFQEDGSTEPAVRATREHFRCYPLSRADDPPAMEFQDVSGIPHNTIHRMDFGFWEEVDSVIQREPTDALSPEILGLLASIGIRKGQPFEPDARMRAILSEAADVAAVTARALTARPRDPRFYLYPGEGVWTNPFLEGRYDFLDDDGARLMDSRTYMHFYATGITPAMSMAPVGKGSQYAIAYLDAEGRPLDGSRTYRIHLPPNVPVNDFWSFTLYDNQTRSMLQTDARLPGIDSGSESLVANADGSYDVYFGPEPEPGHEGNWVQTVPDKGWNVILRLYGPRQEWFDKTWRPGDPERVR